jgi:tetratricopeptide (TPR) repeat protein
VMLALAVATHLAVHKPSHVFAEGWGLAAGSLQLAGRYDEAAAAADRALAADPGWAHALVQKANVASRRGDAAAAEEALRAAVAASPDYQQARLGLGMLLARRGEHPEAEEHLRHALSVVPGDTQALGELAGVLLARGEVAEAGELYRRYVQVERGNADAWLTLARLDGAARRPREGAEHAARATAVAPDRADAWLLLAMLSLDAGDAPGARRALAEAERLAGADTPQVMLAHALLARLERRPAEAEERLKAALRRYPGFREAAELLLRDAAAQGRRAEAEAFLATLPGAG